MTRWVGTFLWQRWYLTRPPTPHDRVLRVRSPSSFCLGGQSPPSGRWRPHFRRKDPRSANGGNRAMDQRRNNLRQIQNRRRRSGHFCRRFQRQIYRGTRRWARWMQRERGVILRGSPLRASAAFLAVQGGSLDFFFLMRRHISIRGRFHPSVGPYVPCYFWRWKVRILGASCAVYPSLFFHFFISKKHPILYWVDFLPWPFVTCLLALPFSWQ